MWAALKAKIHEMFPELTLATDDFLDRLNLEEKIQKAWEALPEDLPRWLIDSLPDRLRAIVAADTKYQYTEGGLLFSIVFRTVSSLTRGAFEF